MSSASTFNWPLADAPDSEWGKAEATRTQQLNQAGNDNGHKSAELDQIVQSLDDRQTKKRNTSADILDALENLGYSFRLNLLDDSIEVNGTRLTDPVRAQIRTRMRDRGFIGMQSVEDAYLAYAYGKRYHPVHEYLDSLHWNGQQNIAQFATYFSDPDGVILTWLRRWLIGAVAKAYTGAQNPMLVFVGPQGIGKSSVVRHLCPLADYFIEEPIDPEDKDSEVRLMSKLVWEVSELGATTRRADREALKSFISRQSVTVRKAYGHTDTVKPALASFIGTINDENGFLADKTGSRRFLVCRVDEIDFSYAQMNPDLLWAEAVEAYNAGEKWQLSANDSELARKINEDFEVVDPIEGLLAKCFILEPGGENWKSSADILTRLETYGLRGSTHANSMALAATMKHLEHRKERRRVNNSQVWGYLGVEDLPTA